MATPCLDGPEVTRTPYTLDTARLKLRQWRAEDREPFAALNADPVVMAHFPAPLDRPASDALADRCETLVASRGWGFWALELRDTGEFAGFTGLHVPAAELPFSPCVEIGWRLARAHWGRGLASEAAREALRFGFEQLCLAEVVSFTAVGNTRSCAVMTRLGMAPAGTFAHPALPPRSALREHVLYRLTRERWLGHNGAMKNVTP